MTPDEAADLAVTIADGWPGRGMTADTWADKLANLHHATATATFNQLQDTDEHPPSWARFYAIYRSRIPTPERFRAPCGICEGTGWRQFTAHREGYGNYSAAAPCDCSNGRQYDAGFAKALEDNERERRRTAPASAYLTPPRPPVQQTADF